MIYHVDPPSPVLEPVSGVFHNGTNGAQLPFGHQEQVAELRVGTRTCQCTVCLEFFVSVTVFDRHLKGMGTANPKCLTARQMKHAGLERNCNGVWKSSAISEA